MNRHLDEEMSEFFPDADAIGAEISIVQEMELSPDLCRWVDAYGRVGHRNLFLWKWCLRGVEITTLSSVADEQRRELCDTKVLGVMLDVLLDDIADQGRNPEFLEFLLSIPYGTGGGDVTRFTSTEQTYAALTREVWEEIQRRIRRFPRHAEFDELLKFDYLQLLNTMRYSYLLNSDPALLNLAEHDLYLPHNMHMMISSTMDLMCSPTFDRSEIGRLREGMWKVQYMGRVGNLVTTWQREIREQDFTSGVFAHAVASGTVSVGELAAHNQEQLEHLIQSGDHESFFLARWQAYRKDLIRMQPHLASVDLGQLVRGLERLICLHMGSRGHK